MGTKSSRHDRKLKNLLLMPKVQLKYMYYIVALVSLPMSIMLAYALIQLYQLQLKILAIDSASTEIATLIENTTQNISISTIACFIFLVVLVSLGTLMASHKFIGPLYVINKYIAALKDGNYEFTRELRKDDEMKETLALLKDLGKKLSQEEH